MKDDSTQYDVMFIIDEQYNNVLPTLLNNISIVSSDILDNLKFNISYFGNEKSSEDLLKSLSPLNLSIKLKNIPSEFVELNNLLKYHYSKTTHYVQIPTASVYYRFFLASTWPELNGKLLYLDTDILVRESLSKLFALIPNQNEYPLLAPAYPFNKFDGPFGSRWRRHLRSVNGIFKESEKLKKECKEANLDLTKKNIKPIFNGGVWFYDLDIIRGGTYEDKMRMCMEMQSIDNIFNHNDQGIMNFVFSNFYCLPPEWNSLGFGYAKYTKIPFHLSKIVHFNGKHKPWGNSVPRLKRQDAYKEWKKYNLFEE